MKAKNYTAIIVNYNGKEVLGPSLDSLLASTLQPSEIIVVDNASKDGSVEFLRQNYPQVVCIESGGNIGFGPGNNLGIARAKSDYILLMNNDLQVEKNCIELLLEKIESDEKLAVVSPFMYRGWDKKDTSVVYSFGSRIDEAGFTVNVEKEPEAAAESNCFTAACCLFRADVLQKLLFEPSYFLYYEEPELTIRLAKLGYKVDREEKAIAWHLENYSSPENAAIALCFRQFYAIQNRWFALGKHWPLRRMPKALFFNWLHTTYFLIYYLKQRQFRYCSLLVLAPLQFLRGVVSRKFNGNGKNDWSSMLYQTSLRSMLGLKKRVVG